MVVWLEVGRTLGMEEGNQGVDGAQSVLFLASTRLLPGAGPLLGRVTCGVGSALSTGVLMSRDLSFASNVAWLVCAWVGLAFCLRSSPLAVP